MNEKKPAPAVVGRAALMSVIERVLDEISREREPGQRPTKDDLLAFLASGDRKLNLFFIRHLPPDVVSSLRRDPAVRDKLVASLRQLVISLRTPLLMPPVVRSFLNEATAWPMAEVRRHPDLWAARILAAIPLQPHFPLPLVSLRELMEGVQRQLETDLASVTGLEELDGVYGFIERELASTPALGLFFVRAQAIAEGKLESGDIIAYYRLLGMRLPATLERLEPSPDKDKVLVAIKEATGVQDAHSLKLHVKKMAMARADELMKEASNYQDLLELRFFFSQIGERSNRKLFSRKTGELARKINVRAEGYDLLGKLSMDELDDDGLLELVPAVIGRAEQFVLGAPQRFLVRLMKFYLETACPLLRRLKSEPERVPRLIQNFKRQVGLLNLYRNLDHLAQTMQRKMVLAICGPEMLSKAPDKILSFLTRLPPEFYPPKVMEVIRGMVRRKGAGYRFTAGDALVIFAAYPPAEEEEVEGIKAGEAFRRKASQGGKEDEYVR